MTKPAKDYIALTTKAARLKAHLTQKEVAEAAGISVNYYAQVERGEASITVETLYKIAKALGVKATSLLPS